MLYKAEISLICACSEFNLFSSLKRELNRNRYSRANTLGFVFVSREALILKISLEQVSRVNVTVFCQLENSNAMISLVSSAILMSLSLLKKTRLFLSIVSIIFAA